MMTVFTILPIILIILTSFVSNWWWCNRILFLGYYPFISFFLSGKKKKNIEKLLNFTMWYLTEIKPHNSQKQGFAFAFALQRKSFFFFPPWLPMLSTHSQVNFISLSIHYSYQIVPLCFNQRATNNCSNLQRYSFLTLHIAKHTFFDEIL